MPTERKIRVAVLYGGRSGEHEVSLQSAASVLANLDRERFDVVPISVDRDGTWRLNDLSPIEAGRAKALPVYRNAPSVVLPPRVGESGSRLLPASGENREEPIDIFFPVMHGPLCEDGSIQGLFELADVPYVGARVAASAMAMDKDITKRLVAAAGLPVVPWIAVHRDRPRSNAELSGRVERDLGYPVFVKPATLGSSIGVHKVTGPDELAPALEDAFRYDLKVLIEKAIDGREIELAVLENREPGGPPLVSIPGEVAPSHEFYSYEAKYIDENGAALIIPADLESVVTERMQDLARRAFECVECEGMARIDFFLERSGAIYFNEINTIPGFTTISMFPKLWEASGLSYSDLLSYLVDGALRRYERRRGLVREWHIDTPEISDNITGDNPDRL